MSGGVDVPSAVERAHEAWKRRWESEREAGPAPTRRYVMAFDCTEEEFEGVRLAMAGRKLSNKACRLVPAGWIPGERL